MNSCGLRIPRVVWNDGYPLMQPGGFSRDARKEFRGAEVVTRAELRADDILPFAVQGERQNRFTSYGR